MCRNTDIGKVQPRILRHAGPGNGMTKCSNIRNLDLSPWGGATPQTKTPGWKMGLSKWCLDLQNVGNKCRTSSCCKHKFFIKKMKILHKWMTNDIDIYCSFNPVLVKCKCVCTFPHAGPLLVHNKKAYTWFQFFKGNKMLFAKTY